ncbi:MAG: hypothetical protein KVP17_001293 [Porospora cf. gigantea B]|uniref:uncharacterized protein n=1 Tax=Porospora cf. gigantea B TaxID=2853592 RepID=UPI003571FA18|nr:MAG: hypothetical protein KVP17_001293 [Porospora cf. gigantea B]
MLIKMARFRPVARMPEDMMSTAEAVDINAYKAQKAALGIDSDSDTSSAHNADDVGENVSEPTKISEAEFYRQVESFCAAPATIITAPSAETQRARGRAVQLQLDAMSALLESNISIHHPFCEVNSLPSRPVFQVLARDISKKGAKQAEQIGSLVHKLERRILTLMVRLRRVQRSLVSRQPEVLAVVAAQDNSDFMGFSPNDPESPEARLERHARWQASSREQATWDEVDAVPKRVSVWCVQALDKAKTEKEVVVNQSSFKALNQSYKLQIRQAVLENYERFIIERSRPSQAPPVVGSKLVILSDNLSGSSFKQELYCDDALYVQLLKDAVNGLCSLKRSHRAVQELKRFNGLSKSAKRIDHQHRRRSRKKMVPTETIPALDSFLSAVPAQEMDEDVVRSLMLSIFS